MSSAASGAITRRYRSKAGLASRHSAVTAVSLPDWAAVGTAANSSPTTQQSIGTLAPSRSRLSALVSNGMRLVAAGRQTGSRWRRSAVVPVTFTVTASTPVARGRHGRGHGDGAAGQYLAGRPHRDDRAARQVPVGYPNQARPQPGPAQLPGHRAGRPPR